MAFALIEIRPVESLLRAPSRSSGPNSCCGWPKIGGPTAGFVALKVNIELGSGKSLQGTDMTAYFQVVTVGLQACLFDLNAIFLKVRLEFVAERLTHQAIQTENLGQRAQVGPVHRELDIAISRPDQTVQFSPGDDVDTAKIAIQVYPGHLAFRVERRLEIKGAFAEQRQFEFVQECRLFRDP